MCVRVCMHACVYLSVCEYECVSIWTCWYMFMYTRVCIYVYVSVYTYVWVWGCMHLHNVSVCVRVGCECVCACMPVCKCMFLLVCVYVLVCCVFTVYAYSCLHLCVFVSVCAHVGVLAFLLLLHDLETARHLSFFDHWRKSQRSVSVTSVLELPDEFKQLTALDFVSASKMGEGVWTLGSMPAPPHSLLHSWQGCCLHTDSTNPARGPVNDSPLYHSREERPDLTAWMICIKVCMSN